MSMELLSGIHFYVGLGGFVVFLATGVYMVRGFPKMYGNDQALHMMYRANHIYLLFSSLLNLSMSFGSYSVAPGWLSSVFTVGALLVAVATPLLIVAFFHEVPKASFSKRAVTGTGIAAAAFGLAMMQLTAS